MNYAITEKEFLVVVFALDKFRSYLVSVKIIIYTDHATIRYLLAKQDANPIRYFLNSVAWQRFTATGKYTTKIMYLELRGIEPSMPWKNLVRGNHARPLSVFVL